MSPTRLALFALLLPAAAPAALFHLGGSTGGQQSPAITLRKRVHVNTLITQPGTMDSEWASGSAPPQPTWCGTVTSEISPSPRRSRISCEATRARVPAPPPSHATTWG